jgi:hypothetical protein
MQIERALGELGQLGEAAGNGQARHRMGAEILEQPTGKIPHVETGDVWKPVEFLCGLFRRRAGGA